MHCFSRLLFKKGSFITDGQYRISVRYATGRFGVSVCCKAMATSLIQGRSVSRRLSGPTSLRDLRGPERQGKEVLKQSPTFLPGPEGEGLSGSGVTLAGATVEGGRWGVRERSPKERTTTGHLRS